MANHVALLAIGLAILAGLYGAYPGTSLKSAIIVIAFLIAGAFLLAALDRTAP